MSIQAADIADLINSVRAMPNAVKKFSLVDLTTDTQKYLMSRDMLKLGVVTQEAGDKIRGDAVTDIYPAQNYGLYDKDEYSVKDVIKKFSADWSRLKVPYAWDVEEVAMNRDPAKLVNLIDTRRYPAWMGFHDKLNRQLWSKPTDSTEFGDDAPFLGIMYWLPKNLTQGFNSGNPSGFSDKGGISATTEPRWAAWTDVYANVTDDDLVFKMRLAAFKTDFESPAPERIDQPKREGKPTKIYCRFDEREKFSGLARKQNDSVGFDLDAGKPTFQGNMIEADPLLTNEDADAPVYMINWSWVAFVELSGFGLRESKVKEVPGMRNTVGAHIEMTGQCVFMNLRAHAVLAKTANVTQL